MTVALLERGVAALPIHDAVAMPRSCADIAEIAMQAEAERLIGAAIPVDIHMGAK